MPGVPEIVMAPAARGRDRHSGRQFEVVSTGIAVDNDYTGTGAQPDVAARGNVRENLVDRHAVLALPPRPARFFPMQRRERPAEFLETVRERVSSG